MCDAVRAMSAKKKKCPSFDLDKFQGTAGSCYDSPIPEKNTSFPQPAQQVTSSHSISVFKSRFPYPWWRGQHIYYSTTRPVQQWIRGSSVKGTCSFLYFTSEYLWPVVGRWEDLAGTASTGQSNISQLVYSLRSCVPEKSIVKNEKRCSVILFGACLWFPVPHLLHFSKPQRELVQSTTKNRKTIDIFLVRTVIFFRPLSVSSGQRV